MNNIETLNKIPFGIPTQINWGNTVGLIEVKHCVGLRASTKTINLVQGLLTTGDATSVLEFSSRVA